MTRREPGEDDRLVLASGSPRRRELLRAAGIDFDVVVSGVPEAAPIKGETYGQYAARVAVDKARAVAAEMPARWVLGADTIVVLDDVILGKPADQPEAVRMLQRLSGRTHCVVTGIALVRHSPGSGTALIQQAVETRVKFRDLSAAEIEQYAAGGEPMDKAGAYGIQGLGAVFVAEYDGSYTNVVGLPMEALQALLAEHAPRLLPMRGVSAATGEPTR